MASKKGSSNIKTPHQTFKLPKSEAELSERDSDILTMSLGDAAKKHKTTKGSITNRKSQLRRIFGVDFVPGEREVTTTDLPPVNVVQKRLKRSKVLTEGENGFKNSSNGNSDFKFVFEKLDTGVRIVFGDNEMVFNKQPKRISVLNDQITLG